MRIRRFIAAPVVALLLAACGSDDDTGDGAARQRGAGDFPVTIEAANGEVEIRERPERIVSLSPTATEMLFAVGAGQQVVAVDDQSNYPKEAPSTELSGFTPNIEAIAEFEPDVVVLSDDIEDVVASLEKVGIPVVWHPAAKTLDEAYEQIEQLGTLTGNVDEAKSATSGMRVDIDEIVSGLPELDEPPSYFHELDDNLFTVTSKTFIGQVYRLAGLRNIADAVRDDAGGFPQLSPEFVVEQDPDLIFLADARCCGQSADTLAQRPGWNGLGALQQGNVVELDDDIASRWGPRVVDFLRLVADSVTKFSEGGEAGDEGAHGARAA